MIPSFGSDGNLPAGIHATTWDEFAKVFGSTFLEFFQIDKDTGNPKGIIALDLQV